MTPEWVNAGASLLTPERHGDSWYPRDLPRSSGADRWLAIDRGIGAMPSSVEP